MSRAPPPVARWGIAGEVATLAAAADVMEREGAYMAALGLTGWAAEDWQRGAYYRAFAVALGA